MIKTFLFHIFTLLSGCILICLWYHYPVVVILGIVLMIVGFILLLKSYLRNDRDIGFLLEAIKNGDTAIKFSDKVRSRKVASYLDEIVQLLAYEKESVIRKESYYEHILAYISSGVVVIDDRGMVYQHNRRALALLDIDVLTHINQLQKVSPRLTELMAGLLSGARVQTVVENRTGVCNLLIEMSAIRINDKLFRIFVINDIGRELNETEVQAWSRLTRVLIHEIMNSLAPVTSLSQTILSMDVPLSAEIRSALESINITSRGLIRFVESYRTFARKPVPSPSIFSIRPFLERMVEFTRAQRPDVDIFIKCCDVDLMLYADESLIGQVVTNLINNAVNAIDGNNGKIWLEAYCDTDDHVYVEVANTGSRIPDDLTEQIFVPFFTTRKQGNGIGLSVSRQIMSVSGGTLTLLPYTDRRPATIFRLKFD